MPRISELELGRLNREADFLALVRARGIEMKPNEAGQFIGICPFHEDTTSSMTVEPGENRFHCRVCGAQGTVTDFIMLHDGLSLRHAVEVLRSGQASALVASTALTRKATVPKLPPPVAYDADDRTLLGQVIEYYNQRLMQTPAALEYLDKRGLMSDEAIKTFRLGFADRTLGLRLPNKNRKAGAAIRARLAQLGIYRESGHEHLNGCIVFPIISVDGEITQIYGRKIIEQQTTGLLHLYLPGPRCGLWNPACLASRELILCQDIIGALTFWVNGIKNVTATYGADGLTEEMEEAMVRGRLERVFIAFDRDRAGEQGTTEVAARLKRRGIDCRRVTFPQGQDANEYARMTKPAGPGLGVLVNGALWIGDGTLEGPSEAGIATAPTAEAVRFATEPLAIAIKPISPPPRSLEPETKAAGSFHAQAANPPPEFALTLRDEHWYLTVESREYRVGGLERAIVGDALKVALRLRVGDRFHLDALDLARDADRRRFVERAAEETGLHADMLKRDMGRLLMAVEQAQFELARTAEPAPQLVSMTEEERAEALAWLTTPDLIGRLRAAFHKTGIIGEENNTLLAYLAGVSRLLERPLAIIVQSASAAGKTTLMDAVLAFFPEEERVKYSAMTGQSLYYLGEKNLKHKILAIVEEAGAQKASYALKLLQSEGELTIASTGKDPQTGRMETQVYRVEGPVMIMLTTTAIDLDEELQNRCMTLSVDESPEQTAKIHALQRERRTLAGLVARIERENLLRVLRNAQRLLTAVDVLNPYAPALKFPSQRTRNRRDHEKYLTLIDSIALLHQHQRTLVRHEFGGRTLDYVPVTVDDIELANQLAPEVLGRSQDELPPQTRALLGHICALMKAKKEEETESFTRRELREACGWSLTQVRLHLERLRELEYLELRNGRMGSTFSYRLMIDPEAPEAVAHIGLIDVRELRRADMGRVAGRKDVLTGGGESPPPPTQWDPAASENGGPDEGGGGLAETQIRTPGQGGPVVRLGGSQR
jgi:DNA primase